MSEVSKSLQGRTALVTGSTDGLGRCVAIALAGLGASVIVHGRNRPRGEDVVRRIQADGGAAVFYAADLASLETVRRLADTVLKRHGDLHILINNAGTWKKFGARRTSVDGHEMNFAVNYLSGFALTHRLLPRLRSSAPARVINVSSVAQRPIDFDDVMLTQDYSGSCAYRQSKLAQILFTFDLARELEGTGVTVNCVHPALLMDTTMVREGGFKPLCSVEQGATAVMQLAVSPLLEGRTGLYFKVFEEARPDDQAYDEDARARLAALTRSLVGLDQV